MMTNFWDSAELKFKNYSDLVENLYLASVIDSFSRLETVSGIVSFTENKIRNHLAFDLENKSKLLKPYFQNKTLKLTKENTLLLSVNDTRRTDIEFFISGYGDFVVECKNLRSAEGRYIVDGINRFVTLQYSKNDKEAAMIGFVIGGRIDRIVATIKTNLKGESSFIDVANELERQCLDCLHSFHSTHNRTNKSKIRVHHLFVNLMK